MIHTRRFVALAGLFAILLASCAGPTAAPVSTVFPTATTLPKATQIPHAPELRLALIGAVTDVNVWALFDSKGYSYNNYAVRNEYWPHLYQLSIPDRNFQTMAASDTPSAVQQDGNFYTATVPLRADLKWTDGNPFTADDVAFTTNTALAFKLGFDWHDFYNPDYLDHAEAVDAHTVRFVFKKQPNVGVWQYGALQGPIIQKAYWSPKIEASAKLLPSSNLNLQIDTLRSQMDDLQKKVDALNQKIATATMSVEELHQAQADLKAQQGDLDSAQNALAKAQAVLDTSLSAAQESLYAISHENEPTLGNWIQAGGQNNVWMNKVNAAHPFGQSQFDQVSYQLFTSVDDALNAVKNDKVNEVLALDLNVSQIQSQATVRQNPSNSVQYLAFNLSNSALADVELRQALACMISTSDITETLPLTNFVSPGNDFWKNSATKLPCTDQNINPQTKLEQAIQILRSAGYTWNAEPSWDSAASTEISGTGFHLPNSNSFPNIILLSPPKETDGPRAAEADFIAQRASILGIPLAVHNVRSEDIRFAVFSSGQYDMAILGWRVSEYPGYLCDWFGDGNPFGYNGASLKSACDALNSTSDLNEAQKRVYQIQSILAQDLPMIPLYSGITYDAYRNISYPFDSIPGGLSGIYGAPALAIPTSQ